MLEPDDVFHLTAVDVRRYEFQVVMRGYDRTRVDLFRQQVADELERLARANQELEEKAHGLADQLRAFRERDRALNEALVSAQQLRAEMKDQATREADLILEEARAQASKLIEEARVETHRMLEGAREDVASYKRELEALDRSRRTYLSQMRALAERHLAEAQALDQQRGNAPEPR